MLNSVIGYNSVTTRQVDSLVNGPHVNGLSTGNDVIVFVTGNSGNDLVCLVLEK